MFREWLDPWILPLLDSSSRAAERRGLSRGAVAVLLHGGVAWYYLHWIDLLGYVHSVCERYAFMELGICCGPSEYNTT